VNTSGIDPGALLNSDASAHDGGQVELDGALGNVEVTVAKEATDDGLIFSQGSWIPGSQTADELLGAVVSIALASGEEHLINASNGSTVTTVGPASKSTVTTSS